MKNISLSKYKTIEDYHAALDEQHLQICEDTNVTFERLVELNVIKMKHSINWASWQLQRQSMTKLDRMTAVQVINCA